MDIGKLNRRVVIKQPPVAQDSLGQPTGAWTDLATVWANVRYLNGVETLKADSPTSQSKASIRIRHRTDVTAAMRLVLGATVFQINAVLPDEQGKQYVDLVCEVIA
jgi:SPP1 family predicted phage head-tail adaptor